MPTVEQLKQLAAWLAGTDIGLLELRTPTGVVRLGRDGGAAGGLVQLKGADAQDDDAAPDRALSVATATSVGVFLHAHPQSDAPAVRIGERVSAGQELGFLRIGLLLLPVNAPVAGRVSAVPTDSGRAVGYGAALVELHAD
ncbi:acetyl-CoA carboxylase biotin carboxyl carrier protein [Variovorax sp. GT1P44]|uniref:acetyl-CoA carboxylase biotin carboxyl carrier protein n=1 Tax=Variovorax sp. GT1P44 TaxID=3443742 RepID=UPI003F462ABD